MIRHIGTILLLSCNVAFADDRSGRVGKGDKVSILAPTACTNCDCSVNVGGWSGTYSSCVVKPVSECKGYCPLKCSVADSVEFIGHGDCPPPAPPAEVQAEEEKVTGLEAKVLADAAKAAKDEFLAEKYEKKAELEERLAEKPEVKAESEEEIAEKDERKVDKLGETGHDKKAEKKEKEAVREEKKASRDEEAAEKAEKIAEEDERKAQKYLNRAEVEERQDEQDEKSLEKEENTAEDTGVGSKTLQDVLQGEMEIVKEEMATRRNIWRAEQAQKAEDKAEKVERQTEEKEQKVEKEEAKIEKEAENGDFKEADVEEASVEIEEKVTGVEEVTAETKEQKAEMKSVSDKVMRSDSKEDKKDSATRLYDMEGVTVPSPHSSFSAGAGVFATGLAAVGFGIVAFRARRPTETRRERFLIPLGEESDGYDSECQLLEKEGPAE